MRYWWVNHKKTSRQEIAGGYLWSPRHEASGARSQFYENMRVAAPGDRILSFSGGLIRYVGIVLGYAVPAFKPAEFGATGEYWANDGWLLPVEWQQLPVPVYPKSQIAELGKLLPAKYSPIHPESGYGNQKAYLAEVSEPVFDLLLGVDWPELAATVKSKSIEQSLLKVEDQVQAAINSRSSWTRALQRTCGRNRKCLSTDER
jgi:putative restriction endonuclease